MELKNQIKQYIAELQNCAFKVLATICNQSTNNTSAIQSIINDTWEKYLKEMQTFEIFF